MGIGKILEEIQNNSLFLRLKDVVENGFEGDKVWHDHEAVFDHSMKTLKIAQDKLSGDFITNADARKLFILWKENNIFGAKQKDLSQIIALIHDCGKILHYKEGKKEGTIITKKHGFPDQVLCPGHEYFGAKLIVPELLKNISLSDEAKGYIQQVIEYHGLYSNPYFPSKSEWSLNEIMDNVKSYYCGFYIEGLFNMYCDGYTATAFDEGKRRIEELFNTSDFYTLREYFIPEK